MVRKNVVYKKREISEKNQRNLQMLNGQLIQRHAIAVGKDGLHVLEACIVSSVSRTILILIIVE